MGKGRYPPASAEERGDGLAEPGRVRIEIRLRSGPNRVGSTPLIEMGGIAKEFSKRSIAVLVLAMVVATVLTVMGAYCVLHRFVLDNPADPLTKAGDLRPGHAAE
jgi:hypothetical protein